MKKYIYGAIILVVSLTADIITKYLIVKNVHYGEHIDYLGGFFRITLVYNKGGVFGIAQGYKNVFLVVSIIVLALIVLYYIFEKNKTFLLTIALAMIIPGAIGNIIDRLVPGRPGVVDFISIGVDGVYRWPAFNIADSSIVVGAALLIIVFYREIKEEKKQKLLEGK